jgi:Na+-driven multidrug efflux pump
MAINRSGGQIATIVLIALLGVTSTKELAIFSLSLAMISVLLGIASTMPAGVQNFASAYCSANNENALNKLFSTGLLLAALVSAGLYVLAFFMGELFFLFESDAYLSHRAYQLYMLFTATIAMVSFLSVFTFFLESVGYARFSANVKIVEVSIQLAMSFCIVTKLIKTNLSPSEGIVISFIISDMIALIVYVLFIYIKNRSGDLMFRLARPSRKLLVELLNFGVPISIGFSMQKLGYALISFIVATVSPAFLAAYTIALNVLFFAQTPVVGIAHANSVLVSKAVGRSDFPLAERYYKRTIILSLGIVVLGSVMIGVGADYFLLLFTNDQQVISHLSSGLLGFSLAMIGSSLTTIIISHLRALKDAWYSQLFLLGALYLALIPCLYLVREVITPNINLFLTCMGVVFIASFVLLDRRSRSILANQDLNYSML